MLSQLRRARGISQEDLSKLLYVTRSTIQHWEAGRRDPGIVMLVRIAHALDAEPSRLFSWFDELRTDGEGIVQRYAH